MTVNSYVLRSLYPATEIKTTASVGGSLKFFPNPVDGGESIFLYGGGQGTFPDRINIVDLSWRFVYKQFVGIMEHAQIEIGPGVLSSGLYLLHVSYDDNSFEIGKLIVK